MTGTEKNEVRDDREWIIARIRQTKAKEDAADAQLGECDGLAWARHAATFRELRALADVAGDFRDPSQLGDEPGLELIEALAKALNEQIGEETSREDGFMELIASVGLGNSAAYVVAFVAAAMVVRKEVTQQVLA